MKKLLIPALIIVILLFSCGVNDVPEDINQNNVVSTQEIQRSPEEEAIDKKLIMLLREQISTEHKTSDAEFKFTAQDKIDGIDCFVYEMKSDDTVKNYAVALDETVIFEINSDGTHTEIYNVK